MLPGFARFIATRLRPDSCCPRSRLPLLGPTAESGGEAEISDPTNGSRPGPQCPVLYRFLDAGNHETVRMLSEPASKKRQGTKSRAVGQWLAASAMGI